MGSMLNPGSTFILLVWGKRFWVESSNSVKHPRQKDIWDMPVWLTSQFNKSFKFVF